ncbi:MAG: glycine cleavage system aminomethyltransferase GcvT [Ilumatobacteraceae bacterium]
MRRSPLDDLHRRTGARLVPFGGWDMPLDHGSTVDEHHACRRSAAMFDVSHLGTVRLVGPHARERIQSTLTNDLDRIGPGRAQYTHLLDDDGSVADDIILWWHPGETETIDVMPNASNTDRVLAALGGDDVTSERAVIAVQGPASIELVANVVPAALRVGRFDVCRWSWRGVDGIIAGTGYTGERGVEISLPAGAATELWLALVDVGVRPAGLGARDTLRLEAGLPLHGHELGPGISPLQAGLDWVVAFDKPTFRGRDALLAERARGIERRLRGIATEGRRPPRAGCDIVHAGRVVGRVTSGNFSPSLGHGIALGFVPPSLEVGADVVVDVRGTELAGRITPLPFVPPGGA